MPSANAIRAAELEAQVAELEAQVLAKMAAQSATCQAEQAPPSAPVAEDARAVDPALSSPETPMSERDRNPPRTEVASAVQDSNLANIQRLLLAQQIEIQKLKEATESAIETKPKPPTPSLEVKPVRVEGEVFDLVIVLACTKSTRSWVDAVKSSIATVVDAVRADQPNAEIRLGLVAYPTLQTHPLTKYVDSVCDFVSTLQLEGGECKPEDIAGGLKKAVEMAFVAKRRRLVLITDASHRGNTKMNASTKGAEIPGLMQLIARSGIDFTLIEVANTGLLAAMLESEYTGVKLDDGLKNDFFRSTLASFGGMNFLKSSVIASFKARKPQGMIPVLRPVSVPSSESVTPVAAVSLEKEREPVTVSVKKEAEPATRRLDWGELIQTPEVEVVRHSLHVHPQTGVDIDWANPELKHVTQNVKVRLLPAGFARGSTKAAHAFFDCEMEKCCVAKFLIDPAATSEAILNEQAQRLAVARRLAAEFASNLEGKGANVAEGMIPGWYEVSTPTPLGLDASMTVFTVEPYILSNPSTTEDEQRAIGDRAQAFSHFTWQKTLGTLMVVDRHGNDSVFRNPVIHSLRAGTFGVDDLASAGMDSFFSAHVCNAECRAWNLASVKDECGQVKSKFVSSEAAAKPSSSTVSTGSIPPPNLVAEDSVRDTPLARSFVVYSCQLCGNIPRVLHTERQDSNEKGVFCEVCAAKAATPSESRHRNEHVAVDSAHEEDDSMAESSEDEDNPRLFSPGEDASDWAVVEHQSRRPD